VRGAHDAFDAEDCVRFGRAGIGAVRRQRSAGIGTIDLQIDRDAAAAEREIERVEAWAAVDEVVAVLVIDPVEAVVRQDRVVAQPAADDVALAYRRDCRFGAKCATLAR